MNVSVTNQIIPKHSVETLATISKFKYLGHITHSRYSMKKYLMLGLTDDSAKLRKTVYKMISRNMRNRDDELRNILTVMMNCVTS